MARENSLAGRGGAQLKPLRSLDTGELIEGFPTSIDEALHLDGMLALVKVYAASANN
jgi:hypothetical protein